MVEEYVKVRSEYIILFAGAVASQPKIKAVATVAASKES